MLENKLLIKTSRKVVSVSCQTLFFDRDTLLVFKAKYHSRGKEHIRLEWCEFNQDSLVSDRGSLKNTNPKSGYLKDI